MSSSLWFPPEQFYTHQVTAPHSTRRSTDFSRIHQRIGLDSTERWVKESWLCAKYCIHIQKRTTYKSWSACTTLSSWVSQGKSAGGFPLPTTLKQLCPPRQGKEHEFAKKEGRVGKHRGTELWNSGLAHQPEMLFDLVSSICLFLIPLSNSTRF